jgi:hypothetical protein
MHPSHVWIEPDALRRLYVNERLSIDQIATRFRCGATTIGRRLRTFSIAGRPRGPIPGVGHSEVVTPAGIAWSPDIAYVVGIIATDGNLSQRPGRLAVVSKDADLLDTIRRCLHLTTPLTPHVSGYGGGPCYCIAWGDRPFYDALRAIGLTPAKSRTFSALKIPDDYFADFLRDCIDGDGSIITYIDRYNAFKNATYVYTRLYVSIVSASPPFIDWLRSTIQRLTELHGEVAVSNRGPTRNDVWRLRYAKGESLALLRWIYYAAGVPCLRRKREIAAAFLAPRGQPPPRRGPGRPVVI